MNNAPSSPEVVRLIVAAFIAAVCGLLFAFYCYVIFVAPQTQPAPIAVPDYGQYRPRVGSNDFNPADPQSNRVPSPGSEYGQPSTGYPSTATSSASSYGYLQPVPAFDYDSARVSLIMIVQQALARYHAAHQAYPANLSDLVPDQLAAALTQDPETHEQFPYAVTARGKNYLLGVYLSKPSAQLRNTVLGTIGGLICGNGTLYCVAP